MLLSKPKLNLIYLGVFSFVGSLALLATPIGYAFAGVLIQLTNVAVLFLITGILIVLNAVIVRKAK